MEEKSDLILKKDTGVQVIIDNTKNSDNKQYNHNNKKIKSFKFITDTYINIYIMMLVHIIKNYIKLYFYHKHQL